MKLAPGPESQEHPAGAHIPAATRWALGIDMGGTAIKAAAVDVWTGELVSEEIRLPTPSPSTARLVVDTMSNLAARVERSLELAAPLPTGVGLPGVVKNGKLMTAANIHGSWVGAPARDLLAERLGRPVLVLNDADAAGIAEMRYGAGVGERGVVLIITLGTGIGTALFVDGHLVPNLEFGHLTLRSRDAETILSAVARERRKLGWRRWAREFNEYIALLERLFWPDVIIVGGGASHRAERFLTLLSTRARLTTARFLNTAGMIGAALAAAEPMRQP